MPVSVIRSTAGVEAMISIPMDDGRFVVCTLAVNDPRGLADAIVGSLGVALEEAVRERVTEGISPLAAMQEEQIKAQRVLDAVLGVAE